VIVAKSLLKFHVESASREGSIEFDCFGHKLFGKLGDILSEPAIQRDSLHVFRSTKHDDKFFLRLNWTVRDGDWHEYFVCLCFDKCQQRLQVANKRLVTFHGHIQDKDFMIGGYFTKRTNSSTSSSAKIMVTYYL